MSRYYHYVLVITFLFAGVATAIAQGNLHWQEIWKATPPAVHDTTHPNYWMIPNRSYTGLAYDKWNDVVYIVNPGTCVDGNGQSYPCPKIYAWDANTGAPALHIGDSTKAPKGQLFINPNVINGSFSKGQYPIYKIDLDDEGRIYASNVVAPIWGVCYPGPPPNCDLDYLNQGPYKIYRWESHDAYPELIYATDGTSPNNSEMLHAIWGTSFDVVGKRHNVGGTIRDSTRIFASGGKFYSGYAPVNDEVNVFIHDDRTNAPHDFRLGVRLKHDEPGSGIAAHGIAATGPYPNSDLWVDSNFRETVRVNQAQPSGTLPLTVTMTVLETLPGSLTGKAGALAYFRTPIYGYPYLLLADSFPTGQFPTNPNLNTRARNVELSPIPHRNWPPIGTPALGNNRFNNLTGFDNWITDVDHKFWLNDSSGRFHLQVFVLMSNNGIACYRAREIWPPVEMRFFTTHWSENSVNLHWAAETQTNNSGFEVYRSFNHGTDWEKLGFVTGSGTTKEYEEFLFTDKVTETHRAVRRVSYRLKQIDYDGSYEWSHTADVLIEGIPSDVILGQNYPNPFNPSTSISYQLRNEGYVTLKVYNALGEEITTLVDAPQTSGTHTVDFNAAYLPTGTYVYRINVDGTVLEKKMAVLK